MDAREWHLECNDYLSKRTGTFEFRSKRYGEVLGEMLELGFAKGDVVVDVGAGRGEFGLYLRSQFPDHEHLYVPIDGSIDGIDIEVWHPRLAADFYVAIELLEHLNNPSRLVREMRYAARKGVVITTPNADATDVLGMDATHKSPLTPELLASWGMIVRPMMLFTEDRLDTIVGKVRPIPS